MNISQQVPHYAPRWLPSFFEHLFQRASSKLGCNSKSVPPLARDKRKDTSKHHQGTRVNSWFSGEKLDDPRPGGGSRSLRRRSALCRPRCHYTRLEEVIDPYSREKEVTLSPLYRVSDTKHTTYPQNQNPQPHQKARHNPTDSLRPSPSSRDSRSGAHVSGVHQVTFNMTDPEVSEKRQSPTVTVLTITITPPDDSSSLPVPPVQGAKDETEGRKSPKARSPPRPPSPEFAPGQPALERYIDNIVSSASPLSSACLKLCDSPVTYTSLRRSEVGIMVSIQLMAARDAIRRQSEIPFVVWKLHAESQSWYAKYRDRILAMEVLVELIERISEHLDAGRVQSYAVVQTWEQLSAVGNLLSDTTVQLDRSFDRLERRYVKRVSTLAPDHLRGEPKRITQAS